MKKIMFMFLALTLMSCGGGSKENSEKSADQQAAQTDETAAETAPGKFRPDTAKIYFEGQYDNGSAFIVISKKELRLNVYATVKGDTTLIARYPVCMSKAKGQKTMAGDMKTPSSTPGEPFEITQIVDASTWTHDFGDGRGPILAYGGWFMRLKTGFDGVGIHGNTGNEDKMPGRDSEGCIRLSDKNISHLKENYAQVGMKVIIKDEEEGRLPFENKAMKGTPKPLNP